jgi:hypothetical protein
MLRTRVKELLYAVEYRRGDEPTKTLPIYSHSPERANEMAREFGERSKVSIIRVTQIPFFVLRFGAELRGEIWV